MISLFKKVIPGTVLPDELEQELELNEDEIKSKEFSIVEKTGLFNTIRNQRGLVSDLIFNIDWLFDLLEKLSKLIYWEDQ